MMTIEQKQEIFNRVYNDLIDIAVPIRFNPAKNTINWDYDTTSTYGTCDFYCNLEFSKHFEEEDKLADTIAHELVHTIENCFDHGKTFHWWGKLIEKELGYNVDTTVVDEDAGIVKARVRKSKWKLVCPQCGHETYYLTKTPMVKKALAGRQFRHAECDFCTWQVYHCENGEWIESIDWKG